MNEIVLVSGGVDSTILAIMNSKARKVFIDYNQKYATMEENAVERIFGRSGYEKISINTHTDFNDTFIPNRNLTLASLAAMYYTPDRIYIGGVRDDNVVDNNKKAHKRMSRIISDYSKKNIEVMSPFWEYSKGEVVQNYIDKGFDVELLKESESCFTGIKGGCMDCPACFRKFVACESNDITVGKPSDRIINKYLKKIHRYDKDRIARTFIALGKYFKIYAVDIDGVLCQGKNNHNYKEREPIIKNIKKINKQEGIKVLYTSRLDIDRAVTKEWLKENGVEYDSLIMGKIPYDKFFEDRAENV